ncbi:MAG: hypothetical protein QG556_1177 [Pseudomonadota bacterium]|nr:hypothetical protein [Pseudomonadota bacterium]
MKPSKQCIRIQHFSQWILRIEKLVKENSGLTMDEITGHRKHLFYRRNVALSFFVHKTTRFSCEFTFGFIKVSIAN